MRRLRTARLAFTRARGIGDNWNVSRLFLLLLLSTACSFDASTTVDPISTEGADAALPGVGVSYDGGATVDANRFEMPGDEQDAAPSKPPPTCEEMYGTATNFDLCEETTNSCRFYVMTNEDTCTNLCSSFGGECIDNYDGDCSSGIGSQGCDIVHYDQVCICTLP